MIQSLRGLIPASPGTVGSNRSVVASWHRPWVPKRPSAAGAAGPGSIGSGEVVIRTGSCRCGHLEYQLVGEFAPVVNCHCSFCRRVHGAAFTTVAFLPATGFSWLSSPERPSTYTTPAGNVRHFCGRCASPVCNLRPGVDVACVVVASLLEEHQLPPWAHVNTESKAPWYKIADGLPQFREWPTPDELRELAREHGSTLPPQLLGPAA